jgi:hypothetical protein
MTALGRFLPQLPSRASSWPTLSGVDFRPKMSLKVKVLSFAGKVLRTTRKRAQRLVDQQSHQWQDDFTIVERAHPDRQRFLLSSYLRPPDASDSGILSPPRPPDWLFTAYPLPDQRTVVVDLSMSCE